MVLVPAGRFLRGSLPDAGIADERPQRELELSAFYIDKTEVTQRAFAKCVSAGACAAPRCKEDRRTDWDPSARADHPVVCIAWADARAFCAWAGKRLPTEAEWEKAARGTDGRLYPWGNDPPTCARANYVDCQPRGTKPVGSLAAGATVYGALDMAGNVWEWVSDWHMGDYYRASPQRDPTGPFDGKEKVVRGGAFSYAADQLPSAGRVFDDPAIRYEHVGVRCAKTAP